MLNCGLACVVCKLEVLIWLLGMIIFEMELSMEGKCDAQAGGSYSDVLDFVFGFDMGGVKTFLKV